MGTTELEIKQNACIHVGHIPIQGLGEDTDKNATLQARYPTLKKSLLSMNPWNFVIKFVQLSKDAATPDGRFSFQYSLPSDSVADGVIAHYVSGEVGTQFRTDFVIQGGKLLSNNEEAWIEYRRDVPESEFPDYFVDLIGRSLAADVAFTLTKNKFIVARNDEITLTLLKAAKRIDSQSSPQNNKITQFTLITARKSGVPSGNI